MKRGCLGYIMSGNMQNNDADVELGPPAADYRAPPPYEPLDSDEVLQPDDVSITDLEVQQLTSHCEYQQQQQQQQVGNNLVVPQLPAPLLPPPLTAPLPAVLSSNQAQLDIMTPGNEMHTMHSLPATLNNNNDMQQQQVMGESVHGQHHGHGKLPTYEEVQMQKSLNGELPPSYDSMHGMRHPPPPPNPLLINFREAGRAGRMGTRNTSSPADSNASEDDELNNSTDNHLLGTDVMFVTAFLVAFIFNWIGFLMLTCFCQTVAARYGALSGFGLSLAKWTLIVKHSTDLASNDNTWLWWLIMAFGFLICIRALVHYISIKRTWRMLSTNTQERLLFFY